MIYNISHSAKPPKRILNEIKELEKEPPENCSAGPVNDDNIFWEGTIIGPSKSPYSGGVVQIVDKFSRKLSI